MIAVLITRGPAAGNAKLLRERDAFVTLRAASGSESLRGLRRGRIDVRLDAVNPVTIRADRRARYTARDCFSMYALIVFIRDVRMTLPAGLRYVRFEDRRAGFRPRRYVVALMTIGAYGGFLIAMQDSASVDALLIRNERTVA